MTPSEVAWHRASACQKIREMFLLRGEDPPQTDDDVMAYLGGLFSEEEVREMLAEACRKKRGDE
jgi:hypothetical protein